MKLPKYYLYLTDEEQHLLVQALVDLKNKLLHEGRYTDVVDEVIIKVLKNKKKKFRTSQKQKSILLVVSTFIHSKNPIINRGSSASMRLAL